jgi:hypothetical protein
VPFGRRRKIESMITLCPLADGVRKREESDLSFWLTGIDSESDYARFSCTTGAWFAGAGFAGAGFGLVLSGVSVVAISASASGLRFGLRLGLTSILAVLVVAGCCFSLSLHFLVLV